MNSGSDHPGSARAGVKLWLERDGELLFSGYRAELLRRIRASGSLARAAAEMGLSYRRAWGKLREIEAHLGIALVDSKVGGRGGGYSRLTPHGEALLAAWDAFSGALLREADILFASHFGDRLGVSRPAEGSGQLGQQVQLVTDDAGGSPVDER